MAAKADTTTLGEKKKDEETKSEEEKESSKTNNEASDARPRRKTRKEIGTVAHLLAHGDPESANKPKTWWQIIQFPLVLAIVFGINLLIFHHAPHHLSKKRGFTLPQREQPSLAGMANQVPSPEVHETEPEQVEDPKHIKAEDVVNEAETEKVEL
jgi:hypothetical protein